MAVQPNQITFKERIAKASERNTHQAATRYLRLRALIEEAGGVIAEAEIPKCSGNKFGAKLLKARRLLDRGKENEVGLMLEDIIDELRNDIIQNQQGIEWIKNDIKQRLSDVCNPQRSKHGSRPYTSPRDEKKAQKFVSGSPSQSRASPNTMTVLQQARKGLDKLKHGSYVSISQRSSPRRKQSNRSYSDENDVDEEEEVNTLNTLQLALHILQELPKANLSDHEFTETEEALKLTKPLLLSHAGCQKLRPFLETLKTSLTLAPHRRQPELNMALQGIRIISYEVTTSLPRKKSVPGILKH